MYYLAVDGGKAPKVPHDKLKAAGLEAKRLSEKERRGVNIYKLRVRVEPPVAPQEGGQNGLV